MSEYMHCVHCGMEYDYFSWPTLRLESWHHGVGLVTTTENFTAYDWRVLTAEHSTGACSV